MQILRTNDKNESNKLKANKLISSAGFVLLFSLLISSILLATGLGISRLMIRQISLASLSRESQIAFFAADSGLECALHWNVFGRFDQLQTPASQKIYCNGEVINDGEKTMEGAQQVALYGNVASCDLSDPPSANIIKGDNKSCFVFSLPESKACAFVVVDKSDPLGSQTVITSNGYNGCHLTAPNILQRTLEITLVNE